MKPAMTNSAAEEFDMTDYKMCPDSFGNVRILDMGFHELIDGKLRRIVDDRGLPVEQPVLLDGKGRRLADGAKPVWLTFRVLSRQIRE